jgi:RNA polymerase primary sigma factor
MATIECFKNSEKSAASEALPQARTYAVSLPIVTTDSRGGCLAPAEAQSRERAARARAQRLLDLRIDFVDDPTFASQPQEHGLESLAAAHHPKRIELGAQSLLLGGSRGKIRGELAAAIDAQAESRRVLSSEEESSLFRRMNYAKHRACRLRQSLDVDSPSLPLMDAIEAWLDEATELRNYLVQFNLPLVVSIVKRFLDGANRYDELVSEGSSTLLRAVERFDAARGNRFSTYATHAVQRCFYKLYVRRAKKRELPVGVALEELDVSHVVRAASRGEERRMIDTYSSLDHMVSRLQERDRYIIRARYGFSQHSQAHTLQRLADELGISKERVRQLEQRALRRLREMAEAGEAELEASLS